MDIINYAMNKTKLVPNLIDWESFSEKVPPISSTVVIYCIKCLCKMTMTIDAIYRNALKKKSVTCMSCLVKEALAKPETAEKIKADAKKKKNSKKFHKALSNGQIKRFLDDKARKNMSLSLIKYWKTHNLKDI